MLSNDLGNKKSAFAIYLKNFSMKLTTYADKQTRKMLEAQQRARMEQF